MSLCDCGGWWLATTWTVGVSGWVRLGEGAAVARVELGGRRVELSGRRVELGGQRVENDGRMGLRLCPCSSGTIAPFEHSLLGNGNGSGGRRIPGSDAPSRADGGGEGGGISRGKEEEPSVAGGARKGRRSTERGESQERLSLLREP